jgi:cathepsin L
MMSFLAGLLGLFLHDAAGAAPLRTCSCEPQYAAFCQRFDRPPPTTTVEYFSKCITFCANLHAIKAHNANPNATYRVELKPLHDLTDQERRAHMGYGYKGLRDKSKDTFATPQTLPPLDSTVRTRNWFQQSRVTDIRDQGQCGSCWAESATGVLESAFAQQSGSLTQLSVQQSAECTLGIEHNAGCGGGWPIDVFRYVKGTSGGLCTEQAIPYTIGNGMDVNCNTTLTAQCNQNISIKAIYSVPTGNESMLLRALQMDVVSIAIDASGQGFYSYASGVYDGTFNGAPDCSQTSLDHAVIAVGYGVAVQGDVPFYVVRNSWGAEAWGKLNGYILFKRGANTCGVAQDATFITF